MQENILIYSNGQKGFGSVLLYSDFLHSLLHTYFNCTFYIITIRDTLRKKIILMLENLRMCTHIISRTKERVPKLSTVYVQ